MQAVNLLPADARASKKRNRQRRERPPRREDIADRRASPRRFAVLLGGLYFHERSVVSSKKNDLANDQAQLAAVQSAGRRDPHAQ